MPKRGFFILAGDPGLGKCLGRGTKVLRADGRLVAVEDTKVGDRLMGPSGVRTIQKLHRGQSPMVLITPTKGQPWVCTLDHVLTLKRSGKRYEDEGVFDMTVREFLSRNPTFQQRSKLFRVPVESFETPNKVMPIDPYFLGIWFGDGTKTLHNGHLAGIAITKPDRAIEDACRAQAEQWGLSVRRYDSESGCPTWRIVNPGSSKNQMLEALQEVVQGDLRVPHYYLTASMANRREFLAGWLDTDGCNRDGCHVFVQKRKDYADAVAFLARSVGLMVTEATRSVPGYGDFCELTISGDFSKVPFRIPRKDPGPRRQRKDPLVTGFTVDHIGTEDYFGFELDGDGRFLLGDFTVTHNSTEAQVAFPNNWTVATGRDILHYHESVNVPKGHPMPRKITYIDEYGLDGKSKFDDAGEPIRIDVAATLEKLINGALKIGANAREENKPPPFDYLVLDEAGELWDWVFADLAESTVSAGGKRDTRGAYGELGNWSVKIGEKLKRLKAFDIGVCLVTHTREAEIKEGKKERPQFPSQTVSGKLVAKADGLILRKIESRTDPEDPLVKRAHYYWEVSASPTSMAKLRGLKPEDVDRVRDMDLTGVLELAGWR